MLDFEKFPVYQKSEQLYTKVLKILSNSKIDKNINDQSSPLALRASASFANFASLRWSFEWFASFRIEK